MISQPNAPGRMFAMPTFYEPCDFSAELFQKHRFLVDCHLYDTKKRWYYNISETAYRAWGRAFPVPSDVPGLACSVCVTKNGLSIPGFVYQDRIERNVAPILKYCPNFFGGGKHWSFWRGSVYQFGQESLVEAQQAFRSACNSDRLKLLFPVQVHVSKGILEKPCAFQLDGFGYYADKNEKIVFSL